MNDYPLSLITYAKEIVNTNNTERQDLLLITLLEIERLVDLNREIALENKNEASEEYKKQEAELRKVIIDWAMSLSEDTRKNAANALLERDGSYYKSATLMSIVGDNGDSNDTPFLDEWKKNQKSS